MSGHRVPARPSRSSRGRASIASGARPLLASGFALLASGFARLASGFALLASGFARLASGFALLAFAGCGISLPDEKLIEDLRILEIRAEPPEITAIDPEVEAMEPARSTTTAAGLLRLLAQSPNLQPVHLEALVAHPDLDATFQYSWTRCKPFGDLPCDGADRTPLPVRTASAVSFSPIDELRKDVADSTNPTAALASFASDPRDLLNGIYANVLLHVKVATTSITVDTQDLDGLKRFVIFDPLFVKVAILEARKLAASGQNLPTIPGVDLPSLCTNVSQAELDTIFAYLDTRKPNRSPTFTKLEYARRTLGVETPTRALGIDEVLTLMPGEQLVFRGRANEEDKESYQLIDDNCQLQSLHETLSWSWFTNRGSLSAGLTVEGTTDRNKNGEHSVYTAPPATALSENVTRVRIWSVLRDGRGGSRARVIEVLVTKEGVH